MIRFLQIAFLWGSCQAFGQSEATYGDALLYQDASWLTSHNSFAYPGDGYYFVQQNLDIDAQLEYGVRSFMLDLHEIREDWSGYARSFLSQQNGTIALCHGSCYGTVTKRFWSFLVTIQQFLSENPREIITLHLESYIDDPQKILNDLRAASLIERLLTYNEHCSWVPKARCNDPFWADLSRPLMSWPTLGQLRVHRKNLIIFIDHRNWERSTPELKQHFRSRGLYTAKSYRESRYGAIKDFENACPMRLNEGRDNNSQSPLFLMNRFSNTLLRNIDRDVEINSHENIMNQVENCFRTEKRLPNFIALNFVERGKDGGGKQVVKELMENRTSLIERFSTERDGSEL